MAFLRTHLSCDECGSSDARSVNVDGSSYCFSCNHFTPPDDDVVIEYSKPVTKKVNMNFKSYFDDYYSPSITTRRLTKSTAERYGVTSDGNNYYFPYYDTNGTLVAAKVRSKQEKKFSTEGEWTKASLFGQQLFSSGGKYVTITEGEFDTLAVFQATGSKWPCVSIRNGATGALKDCRAAYEWLNSFENINKEAIFVQRWWSAESYIPDGIVAGNNLWDLVSTPPAPAQCMYPWDGLNGLTYGIRHGELVTITAGSGLGKSQLLREIVWHLLQNTEDNIGLMFLEEGIRKTGLSVMSLAANKPLHLPDTVASEEERKDAFDRTLGTGRLFLFDHFGSTSTDNIVNRVRYMAKALNCKYIVVDHISIIVSAQDNGDERKAIDEIMTKLRMLVQETNVALFVVSHLKRPNGVGHEEGAATSLAQLRGSGSIAQLSDIVLGAERNGQDDDVTKRNTTYLRVLKNRFSGLTDAC